jgi:hypothetical protein
MASFNCTWTECQKERPFLASVCYAAPGPLLVRPSLLSTVATVNCFLSLLFFLLSLPLPVLVSTLQLSFSQVSALYIFWDFIFFGGGGCSICLEHRVLHLLSRCFTTWVMHQTLFTLVILETGSCLLPRVAWIKILHPAIAALTGMYHHTQLSSVQMGSCHLFCSAGLLIPDSKIAWDNRCGVLCWTNGWDGISWTVFLV